MAESVIHSELGASSYSRWKACPGSVKLCRGIPKVESEYAAQGTRAHERAAAILTNQKTVPELGSEEEHEAVNIYVNHINELRKAVSFEIVEQKFDLSKYYPNLFGTADYVGYYKSTRTLQVVDYKHGAGVPVEVEGNKQLMYYGVGALHQQQFPIEKLILTIVQPRCWHAAGSVRSWETDPMTILDFIADLIVDAKNTQLENAPLVVGDHCRWCNAQGICPAVHEKSLEAAKNVFGPMTTYDPEKLSKTLTMIPTVESWCKSVREFAYREAVAGRVPGGFKLVDKRATRKWVADFTPPPGDMWFEQKLRSPTQMEKRIPKMLWDPFEKFIVKESSGQSLVPDTDSRPEVNKIEEAFSN